MVVSLEEEELSVDGEVVLTISILPLLANIRLKEKLIITLYLEGNVFHTLVFLFYGFVTNFC